VGNQRKATMAVHWKSIGGSYPCLTEPTDGIERPDYLPTLNWFPSQWYENCIWIPWQTN